jgi:NifU-like protein involved in Fe-S cluster formation
MMQQQGMGQLDDLYMEIILDHYKSPAQQSRPFSPQR